jgi:membrane protease YdiL (CAAX protease family)
MNWYEFRLTLFVWFGLGVAGGLACGALWLWSWRWRGSLLPRCRPWRPVPWGGLEVLCLLLVYLLLPEVFQQLLVRFGGPIEKSDLRQFLAGALAFPVQVALIFLTLWNVHRARPFQIGIHTNRLSANVILGYLGWLVLTPSALAVEVLTVWCYTQWTGSPPKPNEIVKVLESSQSVLVWALFWFLAVVAAPVLEELMFRGLVQGWLLSFPLVRPAVAIAMASVLWSGLHPWPDPVPLFVLGLGLGWLAWRTRSLIGPMVLHALFNTVACLTVTWEKLLEN